MMFGPFGWALMGAASQFSPGVVSSVANLIAEPGNVTITGSGVSQWRDLSGSGNHVSQSTDASRPAYVSGWRNGQDAIQGATGDFLQRATLTGGTLTQPSTVYIVGEWSSTGASLTLLDSGGDASNRHLIYQVSDGSKLRPNIFAGTAVNVNIVSPFGVPFIMRATFNGASSSFRIEPHGVAAIQSGSLNAGAQNLVGLTLLANRVGGDNWLGKIASFQLINSALPTEDTEIMAYLRARYNIVHA